MDDRMTSGAAALSSGVPARTITTLEVDFDAAGAALVQAFADAGRRRCSGIGWAVAGRGLVTPRVAAAPAQRDVLATAGGGGA